MKALWSLVCVNLCILWKIASCKDNDIERNLRSTWNMFATHCYCVYSLENTIKLSVLLAIFRRFFFLFSFANLFRYSAAGTVLSGLLGSLKTHLDHLSIHSLKIAKIMIEEEKASSIFAKYSVTSSNGFMCTCEKLHLMYKITFYCKNTFLWIFCK